MKAHPGCLRYLLPLLRPDNGNSGAATVEDLVRTLVSQGNYEKSRATEAVQNALQDGLLKPVTPTLSNAAGSANLPRVARLHEQCLLRLPKLDEITALTHDQYCFECHLPGALEYCRQCTRSFHRLCYRKEPERPNYTIPSAKLQKNRPPAFSSDTDSDSDAGVTVHGSTSFDCESDVRASSSLQQLDPASMNSWTPHQFIDEATVESTSSPVLLASQTNTAGEDAIQTAVIASTTYPTLTAGTKLYAEDYDTESKTKVDVVCLGELRPATRKRPHTTAATSTISYKSELWQHEEEESSEELCTCCRLLKTAALRHPPNMQSDELCHLIGFTFERNRTWISNDLPSYLEQLKMPSRAVSVVMKLLCKIPKKHLNDIANKLKTQRYNFLTEFLVDILDLQHSIGVFFGPNGTEFESTKWLVRDIGYDLSEIRRCPDCFRHSHETRESLWFAKPCVQRHELVFAKHSGFPYWPAKVIRVLPNNKYDVRFFGGNHSRALIESRYIRPIDTDPKSLKLGNTPAIKKALEELRYHQVLSAYPPSIFSFHANKAETEQLIRNAVLRSANDLPISAQRGRPSRSQLAKNTTGDPLSFTEEGGYTNDAHTAGGYPMKRARTSKGGNTPKRVTRSVNNVVSVADFKKLQEELDESLKLVATTQRKNEKLLANIDKLKETIKKYEHEKKILKRKQWCYWCLNEAIYLCCFRAAYCSQDCQSRHWKDGHSKVCKNQDDQRQATSTTV